VSMLRLGASGCCVGSERHAAGRLHHHEQGENSPYRNGQSGEALREEGEREQPQADELRDAHVQQSKSPTREPPGVGDNQADRDGGSHGKRWCDGHVIDEVDERQVEREESAAQEEVVQGLKRKGARRCDNVLCPDDWRPEHPGAPSGRVAVRPAP
jgi:hypothetical protein